MTQLDESNKRRSQMCTVVILDSPNFSIQALD